MSTHHPHCFIAILLAVLLSSSNITTADQLRGLCAKVKIEIQQEMTLERIGFEATLEVTNNDGEDPLTEFAARLYFEDPSKAPDDSARDVTGMFFVQPPVLTSINRIDGSGVIGPTRTAVVRWFIIPKIDAGGTDPRGKVYSVGCQLSCNIRGTEVPQESLLVIPQTITVVPDAQLDITYFQPRYVTGDDPFTPEVESPIPFTLGVLVRNLGYGPANQLQIASQQPRIVENRQGLLLVARLLGTRVMDQPLNETSLAVNLGDIPPGQARKGAWDMITSLSGTFTEFRASYRHAPELGGEETSVITSMNAHFIIGEVINDEPGRDTVSDFLADTNRDGMADTLYETDGPVLPVHVLNFVTHGPLTGNTLLIDLVADREGWGYFRLNDPAQGRLRLQRVLRSDGRILNPRNAWLEERYIPGRDERDFFLHVFDRVDPGNYQYTVSYTPPPLDVTPPVTRLRFSGVVTRIGDIHYITPETQVFFSAEDESPVSIVYKLDDGALQPALPFTITAAGTYQLTYFSTDAANNVEEAQTATLVIPDGGPVIADIGLVSEGLFLKGETISIRAGEIILQTAVAPNPLAVNATVSVYRGTRAYPAIGGLPPSPSPFANLSLDISGRHVDFYKYRINNGDWSAEAPVSYPLELSGLSGDVSLAVIGRSALGGYSNDTAAAVSASWSVQSAAPAWRLQSPPLHPSSATSAAFTVACGDMDRYRWRLDNSYYRAEQAISAPVVIDMLEAGQRSVSLIGRTGGEWESMDSPATYHWTVDPDYGSDYSDLPLVLSRNFNSVQGSTFTFSWDGRAEDLRVQQPGWYTVLIELVDTLGNRSFTSHHVNISDLSGARQTLVASSGNPRNPHGRGDLAVWQQRSTGEAWHIYALDLKHADQAPVAITSGTLSQENPRTDGRYVVWQARRPDGTWDVRMADSHNPTVISDITQTPVRNEINPVICWPWVVYQMRLIETPGAPWQLEAFNIVSGERHRVYPGQDDQLNPAIDAGRVVWRDLRDPGNGEIYFQNLETAETLRLTNDLHGQFLPTIRGNWIAWQDNRHGQVEIYAYHLQQGREVRMTDAPGDKARPYLEGSWLLYEENSYALDTHNLQVLDLESKRPVPLTYDSANKTRVASIGGRIIWQEGTSEPFSLRVAELPALQPVFRSSNTVVVTQQLADRYADAYNLLADWQTAAGITSLRHYSALQPTMVASVAEWLNNQPSGDNFTLVAGSFLWVEFPENAVLHLGERTGVSIDLQAGLNVLSLEGFPLDYTAYRMAKAMGLEHLAGIRMLDAANGQWRSLQVLEDGTLLGPDFNIPAVAVVLLQLRDPVAGWSPR